MKKVFIPYGIKMQATRFDLITKIIYAENYLKHKENDSTFHKDMYRDLILAFNGAYEERNGSVKVCIKDFIDSFNDLIDSIRKDGYNKKFPVIMNSRDIVVDGSHRCAASFVLGIDPEVYSVKNECKGYSYDFFENRDDYPKHGPEYARKRVVSFPKVWLDTCAIKLCRIFSDIKVIVLYPRSDVKYDDILEKILEKHGIIAYKKTFRVTKRGLLNLVKELYYKEEWKGYTFEDKVNDTMGKHPVRVYYFFENKEVPKFKSEIRTCYGIQNNSLHINDTQEEAIRYSQAFLHAEMLDRIDPYFNTTKIQGEFDSSSTCITSSFILEVLGVRKAKDVDVLCTDSLFSNNFSSHKSEEKYYSTKKQNIIQDPRNHFYVHGVKIALPKIVIKFKMARREEKDLKDLELLSTLDNFVDRIFIINLDTREDKYNQLVSQLENLGIRNYERFPAKRGKGTGIKAGVIGCRMSHLAVLKEAKKRGYRQILVLEDDALFSENFTEIFRKIIKEQTDLNWKMLYLGANHERPGEDIEKKHIKKCKEAWTTVSYIIKSSMFDVILSRESEIDMEIDTFYVEFIQSRHFCCAAYPNIIKQRPSISDISGNFADYDLKDC